MSLAKNLKKYRVSFGLSQRELARETNLKQQTISLVELGKRDLSLSSLKRVVKVFGCTIDELVN
nr:helix-turn-helix transcriptional regulator [uncultured Tyzzerella sp.]